MVKKRTKQFKLKTDSRPTIQIRLDNIDLQQIEQLVTQQKYQNRVEFIQIAVSKFLDKEICQHVQLIRVTPFRLTKRYRCTECMQIVVEGYK